MAPVPIEDRPYLLKDDQVVLLTDTSTTPMLRGYSCCDWICELGAVIIDPKTERILLFQEEDGKWSLPTFAVEDGLAQAMENPLQFVEDETGYRVQRLAVRKLLKELRNTESDNVDVNDVSVPATLLSSETSTDAFHVTLDIVWLEQKTSPFQQPQQAMELWYAGYIEDDDPAATAPRHSNDLERVGHLLTVSEALDHLYDNRKVSKTHPRVLMLLISLWRHRNAPDRANFELIDEE